MNILTCVRPSGQMLQYPQSTMCILFIFGLVVTTKSTMNGLEIAGGQFKKTRTSTNLGARLNFRCTSADITIVTAIPSAFHSRNEPSERILCCSRRGNLSYRRPLGKLQILVEFLQWCHSMVANDGALFSHGKISRNRISECRIFTAFVCIGF